MASKKASTTAPKQSSTSTGTALAFGGKVKSVVLPSGSKLLFNEADQDGIIKYLGTKDISDKVGKDQGEVVYLIGQDGRRNVSLAVSYKLQEALQQEAFVPGKYYYLHLADLVETNESFNKMKDFNIVELGSEGETVPVTSDRLPGISEITLSLEAIKELNYSKLNYPLRTV